MAYNKKFSHVYIVSQYGGVMVYSAEHMKMLNFEKIFDERLVKNVVLAYPAMQKFIGKELGKERIV